VPVDGYKTAVCGVLDHQLFFNSTGGLLVDEYDLDSFIKPDPSFRRVITDARRRFPDMVVECCGAPNATGACSPDLECIETEVTPHRALGRIESSWWGANFYTAGTHVCNYGPWVVDTGHTHPEIHPVQLLWVKEAPGSWVLGCSRMRRPVTAARASSG